MIEVIKDHQFAELKSIDHAFFTRKGGVSSGYYDSLNCCVDCKDDPKSVLENRLKAMNHLNLPSDSLISVKNIHGNRVVLVDENWSRDPLPQADAMVTKLKGIALASDSADCPIVLFADDNAEIIGLAHAGWRGALQGILEETVQTMVGCGAKQHCISAVISPCITQESYEVSADFYQSFATKDSSNKNYFIDSSNKGHFLFDLLGFVTDKLVKLNLRSVSAIGLDTYANDALFFSCRRAYHKNEPDFGGHLSCIYMHN